MRKMKYVLNSETKKFLLIPDNGMQHCEVGRLGNWTNAGFVDFETTARDEYGDVIVRPVCFGKSVSLGLESGPKDSDIIFRGIKDDF